MNESTTNNSFETNGYIMLLIMILGALIFLFVIFLIIFINIRFRIKNKKTKIQNLGHIAEINISSQISQWANKNYFGYLGPHLYKKDYKLFEIDSILITPKAIVVIEIKSINGHIRGTSTSSNWEKLVYNRIFPLPNPVIQNERHLKHVIDMLGFKVPMLSLIIFSDRVEDLEIENPLSHVLIIKESELQRTLNSIMQLPSKMNLEQIKKLEEILNQYVTNDPKDIEEFKKIIYGNKK